MGMTKESARAVLSSLKGCPFCGHRLVGTILGAGDWAPNPRAGCATEGCWGATLPALNLDIPEQVAAFNTRWESKYPPGTLFCAECGIPEITHCSCPDSPMTYLPGSRERAEAIAAQAAAKEGAQ
jgi:hypothetical protein